MKRIASIFAGLLMAASAAAQVDYTFNNNNVIPFSLNPALAGNANAMRFGLNYRMQWPALDNHYTTTRISYDQNFYKQMASAGISFTRDNEANVIKKNEIAAVYSHNIRLEDEYFIRLGLQMALNLNYADASDLTFDDSYAGEGKPELPTNDKLAEAHCNFVDFSFGAAFVWENKLTVGGSVYHIGQPNDGFDDKESQKLGRRYVFHVNYMQDLEARSGLWGRRDMSSTYLFGSAAYQQQAAEVGTEDEKRTYRLASLNIGCMTNPVIFGVADKYDFTSSLGNLNVISFMIGGNYKGLQGYYIFDLYTSKKDNGSWSHEFALVYVIPPKHYRYACPIVYW
ncbi:MAG: PorP/SprF family type IX secretion system membrane protein [Paludibacteraceae bacterium]|nr:PorP/SprF family type IX secretion system membrane protein [Paludibacteraceae bacterium]